MDRRRYRSFWLVVVGILVVSVCQVKGEENRKISVNLVSNPSFKQPANNTGAQAELWTNYQCGYTRTKEKSYATDVSGPWSCKITGAGGENEKGVGGAYTYIRSGLPEHGTFTATNNIYITPGTRGTIRDIYIIVYYTDKTLERITDVLTPEQISANLDKWKTYSRTFSTAPEKKIDYVVYWCIVWLTYEKKFTGTVYFDEAELKLADEKVGASAPLPPAK